MSAASRTVWITSVQNDDFVWDALILGQSIQNTFSNGKTVVLYGQSVSDINRRALASKFDRIIPMMDSKLLKEDWETYTKLFGWTLEEYKSGVYLDCKSVMLRNCDELFESSGMALVYDNKTNRVDIDSYVFKFQPSIETYHGILEILSNSNIQERKTFAEIMDCFATQKNHLVCIRQKDIFSNIFYSLSSSLDPFLMRINKNTKSISPTKDDSTLYGYFQVRESLIEQVQIHLQKLANKKLSIRQLQQQSSEPIAIVGMSFRMPGANTSDDLWELLMSHGDAIKEVPNDRWTEEQSCYIPAKYRKIKAGWLKCPVDEFDGKFFGISPAELNFVDPQQRMLLEISWEALEDAAIDPMTLKGTTSGVFTGQWTFDYKELLLESGFRGKDFFRPYLGNGCGMTASRIAHVLELTGRNVSTESGCSSSMVAVGLAMQSLRNGESKIALAAGVNLILTPFYRQHAKNMLAKDGHCKTFDESGDGFVRAEGVGCLVLKRLSDAVRDNDRIHAILRGYGVSQEGESKSLGTPTVQCEAAAMKMALYDAGVHPNEVDFVETHGTGTAVGDPLEMKALAAAYGLNRNSPLVVGSIKTNIGHTESCSGISGIIKTILCFQNEIIPPHRSLNKLNSKINLEEIPAVIPLEAKQWVRNPEKLRFAGVSSYGISGTDCHVILQEPPIPKVKRIPVTQSPVNILNFSAKSTAALTDLLSSYIQFLSNTKHPLNDVAYTLGVGRTAFKYKASIVARSKEDAIEQIKSETLVINSEDHTKSNLCFVFTGQGSQYHGMGESLYKTFPVFKKHFDECEEILSSLFQIRITAAVWGDDSTLIHKSLYSQSSIFVIEYCLFKLYESWNVHPACVLGHSLGEFAAAAACGIINVHDALQLVGTRSRLINKLPRGKMIVVKASKDIIQPLVKNFIKKNEDLWIDYAAFNSAEQTTLSGTPKAVESFQEFCREINLKTVVLDATHAFHSRDMDPMLEEYRTIAASLTYSKPKCNFVSGMLGHQVYELNSEYWVRHTRDAVNFTQASETVAKEGYNTFLEVGPHPVLSALLLQNVQELKINETITCIPSMNKNSEECTVLLGALAKLFVLGININWTTFYKFGQFSKVTLPFYSFQREKYWFNQEFTAKSSVVALHALLGRNMNCPVKEKVFRNFIALNEHPYLSDHKVGSHVIFPGAGYLEMCLAAQFSALNGMVNDVNFNLDVPVTIKDFQIMLPLELELNKRHELQTTVFDTIAEQRQLLSTVSVFSKKTDGSDTWSESWHEHAKGTFSAEIVAYNEQIFNLNDLKSELKLLSGQELYSELSKVGYNFGQLFQSLIKIWKNETVFLAQLKYAEADEDFGYLGHPLVFDAMIQASLVAEYSTIDTLYLPVSIKTATLYRRIKEETLYILINLNSTKRLQTVFLLNDAGEILSQLEGVGFVKTTINAFEKALSSKKIQQLPMFVEDWENKLSVSPSTILPTPCLLKLSEEVSKLNFGYKYTKEQEAEQKHLNTAISFGMLKTFMDLGWKPPAINSEIKILDFMKALGILPKSEWLVTKSFEMLVEDGFFEKVSSAFQLVNNIPEYGKLKEDFFIFTNLPTENMLLKWEFQCALLFISNLPLLLTGRKMALPLLFPETGSQFSAELLYNEALSWKQPYECLKVAANYIIDFKFKTSKLNQPIRIVEVGAGKGSATKSLLPLLEKHNLKYIYTFTDISAGFFPQAEIEFKDYLSQMEFSTLNIEEDPKLQGFGSVKYDIVVASNVLHATKDLHETMRNVRSITNECGLLLIMETLKPQRYLDISFGNLEGYYRYSDFDFRPNHCVIGCEKWQQLLTNVGFPISTTIDIFGGGMGVIIAEASTTRVKYELPKASTLNSWIVFSDDTIFSKSATEILIMEGRAVLHISKGGSFEISSPKHIRINEKSTDDFQRVFQWVATNYSSIEGILYLWSADAADTVYNQTKSYIYFLQAILSAKFNKTLRIYAITNGQMYVSDQQPKPPSSSTILGITRTFKSENPQMVLKVLDLDPNTNSCFSTILPELWNTDVNCQVAFRNTHKFVPRLKPLQASLLVKTLTLPNNNRFALALPQSKNINDLKFNVLNTTNLSPNHIEIEIKAAGLNFRDIFSVLKPSEAFNTANSIGADFAGVVTNTGLKATRFKVGDNVFGCSFDSGALPSHINIPENLVVPLPENMTYADGATLPCVFATAYHCLINIGNLKKNENILIHSATGGVGLCAIQIANLVGANIFATAGSYRKRAYLRNMGIKHVFNSRNTDFKKEIKKSSEEVHLVLNSLTGPGFKEASLNCCAKNARFIEMSKLNIWTKEDVSSLRPDVFYSVEDLSVIDPTSWCKLMQTLGEWVQGHKMKPLAQTVFDGLNICDALHYLEKAKQIGKVICLMPKVSSALGITQAYSFLFNDRCTYIVTGGTQGVGLEVAKWMTELGAKHIILCGRKPLCENSKRTVDEINQQGKAICSVQLDVSNYNDCATLIDSIQNQPYGAFPLRGIMHAAGCLSDAIIPNQTWEKFETTMNPKVKGAWNLHELTKKFNLEHFVMFSSFAAIYGSPGQSNHAASNAYLDALAQYRHASGLPATTVNWGQWGQVGIVANKKINAIKSFSTEQGIAALEQIMRSHILQATVCDGDFEAWKSTSPWANAYFESLVSESGNSKNAKTTRVTTVEFWNEMNHYSDEQERYKCMFFHVSTTIATILKYDGKEKFDKDTSFQELGIDSLMLIEFRNQLQGLLGPKYEITANDMADCSTFDLMTRRILEIIQPINTKTNQRGLNEHTKQLLLDDSRLPSDIQGSAMSLQPSKIKTVLLIIGSEPLGFYLLKKISMRSNTQKIYCLIEAATVKEADNQLQTRLTALGILKYVNMSKVETICGELSKPRLGMNRNIYDVLSLETDAVINCSVYTDFIAPYEKVFSNQSSLRSINVLGTQRIIKLAAARRTKYIYQCSSILANWESGNGNISEAWSKDGEFDNATNFGFGISKYISDRLITQAATERNIPCKIFKFPVHTLESTINKDILLGNLCVSKYLHYLKYKIMPDTEIPMQILPADLCADISLEIFFKDNIKSGVFNVLNPYNESDDAFVEIADKLGYAVKKVPYEEFLKHLLEHEQESPLKNWINIYSTPESIMKLYATKTIEIPWLKNWRKNQNDEFWNNKNVKDILPNAFESIEKSSEILFNLLKIVM